MASLAELHNLFDLRGYEDCLIYMEEAFHSMICLFCFFFCTFLYIKGKLTMIVGTVGSGKSSFLSAILEEMTLQKGTIQINGYGILNQMYLNLFLHGPA